MIELYFWPTPNGHKITLALEELALEYRILPIDIKQGAQHRPEFLAISPNNRMPAIVDTSPPDGGAPISIFESGAILLYLARQRRQLSGKDIREEKAVLEWLFWQVAGLGPMSGQIAHFTVFATEVVPNAIERFTKEVARLHAILDKRLSVSQYVACDHLTIADCAIYPWIRASQEMGVDLSPYPNVGSYLTKVSAREATQRAYAKSEVMFPQSPQS